MIKPPALPQYELTIPSNKEKITIRPFIVREEKLLLMALESKDDKEMINAVKQVLKDCIVSGKVNIDTLPFFDIDYLFIALRAKSIGDTVDVQYKCNNLVNGEECGNVFSAKIDVGNCKVIKDKSISDEIKISGTHTIKMKYPNYAVMKSLKDNQNAISKKVSLIVGSIYYIKDKDKVYTTKDVSREELVAFVENLTQEQFSKLEKWVDNFPTFVIEGKAKCNKCGFQHELEYSDFASFFV